MPNPAVADASHAVFAAQPFTISKLPQGFDLTTRAIRFYEDRGQLERQLREVADARRSAGQRKRSAAAADPRAETPDPFEETA